MASSAKQWVIAGRTALNLIVHQGRSRFRQALIQLKPYPESADYRAWQHRFMRERLQLGFWLAILCTLNSIALSSYSWAVHPQQLKAPGMPYSVHLSLDAVSLLCVFACLPLYRSSLGHRHPELIFLGLSWANTLAEQIISTFNGIAYPNMGGWSLVFMAQATLLPVRWSLHLLSQLSVLVYFLGVNSALGLTVGGQSVYALSGFWLWFFWFCLICDLAVYLYERLKRAEFESSRNLRMFLHAVSHDLKTPVMGTALVLQKLLKQPEDEVTVRRSVLERLLEGNERQLTLINSLLETYTSEVQGTSLHCEPLQLNLLVESVLNDLEPVLAKKQIQVTNRISADLPLVNADATQLWRVFSNLITNALKHNPPGISLTLDAKVVEPASQTRETSHGQLSPGSLLHSTAQAGWIWCSVQDNGVGIPAQQTQRLFELYSRGLRARYMPGLGLGLHLCKQIITAHGGQIGVTSIPGAGSTFWFTLPRSG
jgi:signal transduction histidine kinase